MNPYQALANAIVELAVKDYKKALTSIPATRSTLTRSKALSSSSIPAGTEC